LVGLTTLPVRDAPRSHLDGAYVRVGASQHPLGVVGAGRDLTAGPTGRCPLNLLDRGTMGRVEEAGRQLLRQWQALQSGLHARDGVTAVIQDLGDVADLLGFG